MLEDPDFNLLIALDALLADGSVVGAARKLGLSASAMSRTLARLRETTGDPLLVRAGRRMVLTPYAEALRERTQHAVREARGLLRPSTIETDFATLQRTYTIRANEGFVDAFGAALINAVAAVAPFVRLRFTPKADKTDTYLREGSVDLEIGVLGGMGPEVRVQSLFRDHFIGVVRKGHPLEQDDAVSAERYVSFGHVVASRRGRTTGPVDEALAALGLKRTIIAVVPGFPAALAVASGSDLIALVPASFLAVQPAHLAAAQAAKTYAFPLPVRTEPITVSQMWHPRLEADLEHRWLRRLVIRVCGDPLPVRLDQASGPASGTEQDCQSGLSRPA